MHLATPLRRLAASWQADGLVAAALLALGQFEIWSGATYDGAPVYPGPSWLNALVVVPLLTVPLALRRRAPLVSAAVVLATLGVGSLALGGGEGAAEFIASIVAIYSAAANGDRRLGVLAGALAAYGAHELRDPRVHGPGDVVWGGAILALAWSFGLAVRGRYGELARLEREAARLARDREAHARGAVADERARVARELHDIVAHAVSVVVIQAQAGQRLVGRDDGRARESLVAIEETARAALTEMRVLLEMLRDADGPSRAPQPGLTDLGQLLARVREAGIGVSLEVDGEPVRLAPGLDLSAYRVVQEGLTNVLKHASASQARVRVRYGDEALELDVEDDGGAPRGDARPGRGLAGMRERVALYGGRLESGPRAGGGWLLRARLPLEEAP